MSTTPEETTEVVSEEPLTDAQVFQMLREHIQPVIDHVNSLLPEATESK